MNKMVSFLKSLQNLSEDLLLKKLTYYDSGKYFRFDANKKQWQPSDKISLLIVVSRRCYSVHESKEPITESLGLRKFLQRKNSEGDKQFLLGKKVGSTREVATFHYKDRPALIAKEKRALVIPETALLEESALSDGFYVAQMLSEKLYFHLVHGRLNSTRAIGLTSGDVAAKQVLGVSESEPCTPISQEDLNELYVKGLKKTVQKHFSDLMVKPKRKEAVSYKKEVAIGAAMLAVYFLLSSAYLGWVNSAREEQVAALGNEVEQAISLENAVKSKRKKFNALQNVAADASQPVALWSLIKFLSDADVTINDIVMESDSFELNLSAGSMTELFEMLDEQEFTSSVEFTTSVRRSGGEERATFRVELRGEDE